MTLGSAIRRGVVWSFVGSTGSQVLSFGIGIVLARLLAPSDFGILATIGVFTGLAGFVAGGGMGDALVRAKNISKADYDISFTIQIAVGTCIFSFFFLLAPAIGRWYHAPLYVDLLRTSAVSFLLRPFVFTPASILHREMHFKAMTGVNISVLLISSAVSISLALCSFGVWSLILGGICGTLVNILLLAVITGWRPGLSLDFSRGRELSAYGAMIALGDFLVYLRKQASNLILSKTLGTHALGIYNKAETLSLIPHSLITGPVYTVTFRALATTVDDLNVSRFMYLRAIALVSLYAWPALAALGWLAVPLVRFIYGAKWVEAGPLLVWFAALGPFVIIESLAGCVLAAQNWLKREMPVQFAQLVIVVLGVIAGLRYDLVGVVVGASLASIYGAAHLSWLAGRCLKMSPLHVLKALVVPLLFNTALLSLWAGIDYCWAPGKTLGDLPYMILMLAAGGLLYAGLFFAVPIEAIAPERERWLAIARSSLTRLRSAG